jgi:predicted GNAT family acetyltransferase
LYVESDNATARALYASLGFHEHERHRWYTRDVTTS